MPDQIAPQHKENIMGTMPVNKLLITMSLPMVVSMVVQSLYNIVDSIFVAQINENALTAVSLAFPVQILMIAVGAGTSLGTVALLSKRLGEKNYVEVNNAAKNGVFLSALSSVIFLLVGVFLSRLFFASQTEDREIVEMGVDYMTICCSGSLAMFGQMAFERLLQSTGKSIYSMVSQIVGALVNITLDPIFIFGWFGLPEMGTAGAALATVCGQFAAFMLALYLNVTRNKELHLRFQGFKPMLRIIGRIYSVGLPTIVMIAVGSVMIYGMNNILIVFSSTAAAVLGVYFKLQSFILMPVFGINNGLIPIVAFNYGARNKERIIRAVKLSIRYAFCLMAIGIIMFQSIPATLLSMFNATPDMIEIGVPALRIVSTHFALAGFCIISMTVFQALGMGFLSLLCAMARQLIVLLPAAWLLAKLKVLDLVWLAFPIAEVACMLVCAFFLRYVYKNTISTLSSE